MKIVNRKARFNYELLDRCEAGVVLTGAEVKSAKAGHISLADSYAGFLDDELYLINANISPYKFAPSEGYEPKRSRKLLLHKREILSLVKKMEGKNLSLVPTAIYTKKNKIKIELALARGKKNHEKRDKIKKRDLDREQEAALKNYK